MFHKLFINGFLEHQNIFGFNKDVLVFFLDHILNHSEKKVFLEFDTHQNAKSFYDYCFDYKEGLFLFYPTQDAYERVPGFISESERFRKETLLSLYDSKVKNLCIGTKSSFNAKEIPKDTEKTISSIAFETKQVVEVDYVISFLVRWGYERVDTTIQPGTYSKRGDVLDVFPPHLQNPIRVLFDFDVIETITLFDPSSQRSIKSLNHIIIRDINKTDKDIVEKVSLLNLFSSSFITKVSKNKTTYDLMGGVQRGKDLVVQFKELIFKKASFKERFAELKEYEEDDYSIYIYGENENKSIFPQNKLGYSWKNENLNRGFVLFETKEVHVSSRSFLNTKKNKTKWVSNYTERDKGLSFSDISNMKKGDFIVHRSFGVGVFLGLKLQESSDNIKELLEIEYNNNSTVFVSIHKLNLVHKFIGSSNNTKINSLGSKKWGLELKKTRKAVSLVASELLSLYSKKENLRSFKYIKNNDLNNELKNSFPFLETKDQKKAIEDVFFDMNSTKPMDRLICGDVGFGKTEVAIRAIFKAALSSKQSLFLCPTTVLADQHYISCRDRLEGFGVRVALLSRFKSVKEQKVILEELKMNKFDVVIGTHRVLSNDVYFPNLGLLVVDEEHRFGVNHKEKIRAMKQNVDVLTLTATPIPRTLQQSLVGIRDVSLIQTPPKSRKPIETSIRFFNWEVVFTYIELELRRGGQVFFLQNDIKSLYLYQQKIQNKFSNYSVESLHGKMPPSEMEEKILSFFDGTIDVLVCTTIIESGLDIPNANCIIINDAQNFGLSQLYQIRGRVGRGERQARCLLFVSRSRLKNEAKERLKTLEEFTTLGSGYNISMKDLEIRGAGSLFGYKQSGHISSVGFELYCEMLKEELSKAKNLDYKLLKEPVVIHYGDSYFDHNYIKSNSQRLFFYNKVSTALSLEKIKEIKEELVDRFGPLKQTTINLFLMSEIRVVFSNTLVSKVIVKKNSLLFTLENFHSDQDPLILINRLSNFEKNTSCRIQFKDLKNNLFEFSVYSFVDSFSIISKLGRLFSDEEFV
jgi:transcription-repair coupling factor (superfamily II helicase)